MMKIMLLCLCMMFVFPNTVRAESPKADFKTAQDLVAIWEMGNYPDYYCGSWFECDEYVLIYLLDTEEGEKGKQEILELIEDDSTAKFEYRKYSYKELREIQHEITENFKEYEGSLSAGVSVQENRAFIAFAKEYEGRLGTKWDMWKLRRQYGDKIFFTFGEAPDPTVDYEQHAPNNEMGVASLVCIVVGLILIMVLCRLIKRKKDKVNDIE